MTEVTLLDSNVHHSLHIKHMKGYPHASEMAYCPVIPNELDHVWTNFPVVFIKDNETGEFSCVALFGLSDKENLFVAENGAWMATYAPEALSIYPFSFSPSSENEGMICVVDDPNYCSKTEGERVFDDNGKPSLFLEKVKRRLGNLLAGEEEVKAHIQSLVEHRILTEVAILIKHKSGKTHRLEGLYTPDRNVMSTLKDEFVIDLHRKGTLAFASGCAVSLAHITNLVQRKNAVLTDPIINIEAARPQA